MSAKPGTTPIWNTSAAGMTAPTGGQETNGVADGDFLPAGLFDYLVHWIIQWIKYLSRGPAHKLTVHQGRGLSAGAIVGTYAGGSWSSAAASDLFFWGLPLAEGDQLNAVSVRVVPGGAGHCNIRVLKVTDGDYASADVLGSAASTGAVAETLTVSGLTENVTSSVTVQYEIEVNFATTAVQAVYGATYSTGSTA